MPSTERAVIRIEGLATQDSDSEVNALELARAYFKDPVPGVAGVEANVLAAALDDEDVVATVVLDPLRYVEMMVRLGEEPESVLNALSESLDSKAMADLRFEVSEW